MDATHPLENVFLRPEVKLEPLVCGWYAWTHLLSPAQHALNVVYRQLPLLQSFVKNPSVHLAAAADPSLFGGPFVDLARERIDDVRRLIERTTTQCAPLIALGHALRELDRKLQESATGYSLSQFYGSVPGSLRGLVEFLYDLNHHPQLRVHEEFLYDENLSAGTQELLLSMIPDRQRPFFMSTPRFPSEQALLLPIHFADARLDALARMRTQAGSAQALARTLEVSPDQRATFERFFTREEPARHDVGYRGKGVRVRYFGHACVLLQTDTTSILLDPILAWDNDRGDARFTFHDLPEQIDYLVLSHNHQDHCVPEVLIQLRHRVRRVLVPANNRGCIADPSMTLLLRQLGFMNVTAVSPFDTVELPEGRIVSLPFPGEHVDLDIHSRQGIFIELKERRFAFLVDSDGWDQVLFRRIARRIGRHLDALFLGMECHGAPLTWIYGPLLTKPISRRNDESRRLSGLNSEHAAQVLEEFDPRGVFVYAMGQEPWLRHIMGLEYTPQSIQLREVAKFLEHCRQRGIAAENLFISRDLEY